MNTPASTVMWWWMGQLHKHTHTKARTEKLTETQNPHIYEAGFYQLPYLLRRFGRRETNKENTIQVPPNGNEPLVCGW